MAKRRRYGEGSIFQNADGRWTATLSLGRGADGRRRRKTVYGATKDEVRERLRELKGTDPASQPDLGRETFGEYLDRWLAARRPTIAPKTYAHYAHIARGHIAAELGTVPMTKLAVGHIQGLLASSQAVDPETGKQRRSPRMVQMIRAVLRIALDHEGHWKRLTANVSDLALRVPVVRRAKATAWTQEQAARFLSAARGRAEPLEALWLLAPTTGMRLGELLGLHWSDIDWERGVIHVQRNLVEIDSKIVGLYEPKTEAGKRDVEVTQPVLAALKRQRAALLARGLAAAPMVFPTGRTVESAGYWLQGNVRRELRKVIARTEVRSTTGEPVLPAVPALSFHKLRHTSATLMLAAGVDVKIVSHRLGHSRVGVTQDLYQHVLTDMQRPAAEALDAVLGLTGPKK